MKKNLVFIFIALVVPVLLFGQQVTDTVKPTLPADSSLRAKDSAQLRDTVVIDPNLLDNLLQFQQALRAHPYFNFFGKSTVLLIEERHADGNETFFYLLLALFFYYAFVRLIFYKYHDDLFKLFFRATLRQAQLREQLLQTPLPSLLLNILFVATGSLYGAMLARYNNLLPGTDFWLLCIYCLVILIAIYIGKYLVLKTLGWILRIGKATDMYLFIVFMVNKMVGIFLLPVLLLMAFPFPGVLPVIITLSLFVLAILLGYRFLVSYRLVRSEIKVNLFHFFLYLCAFEIAPLLLIYKVLLTFVGRPI